MQQGPERKRAATAGRFAAAELRDKRWEDSWGRGRAQGAPVRLLLVMELSIPPASLLR